jgi:hypothetical protein
MNLFKTIISIQSLYCFITAVWPIIHIESFMEVTGYKTDIWLVKTVGALLIPVSICLFMHLFIKTDKRPAVALASLTCVAFICIDFYYALNDVISDIYQLDGVIQILLLIAWIYFGLKKPEAFGTSRMAE